MDGLTPGRMAHYVLPKVSAEDDNEPLRHRAAVVNEVIKADIGLVGLTFFFAFTDADTYGDGADVESVTAPYSEEPKPGTWHWIERA